MELSDREIIELKQGYELLDVDNEGTFQARDLVNFMRHFGRDVSERDMQSLINAWDLDGNGTLDFDEFLMAMVSVMTNEPDDYALRQTFRFYDKDNTGFIGLHQMRDVMVKLRMQPSEDELDDIMQEGDEDKDGFLCFEEFANMMTPSKRS